RHFASRVRLKGRRRSSAVHARKVAPTTRGASRRHQDARLAFRTILLTIRQVVENPEVAMVTSAAAVELRHLDNLWIQVSGPRCNIECRHCFNNSGPSTVLGAGPSTSLGAGPSTSLGAGPSTSLGPRAGSRTAADNELTPATTFAVGEESAACGAGRASVSLPALTVTPFVDGVAAARRGESVRLEVVARTRKVGHFFPAGTVDAFDVWLEVEAVDDPGRLLLRSGALENGTGAVDPAAHFYRSVQ